MAAVDQGTVTKARRRATVLKQVATEQYERGMAEASRLEHFASLLELGYGQEEAERRAFGPREVRA